MPPTDLSLSGKESAQGCIPKRLLGRPDYPASVELAESATFCATFAKRKIKILQVVAELQVASGPVSKGEGTLQPSWDGRRPSSAEWGRRGRRGQERMGMPG